MISKELLKQLRAIEIRTQRMADEQLAGTYQSVFKGQGLSFREVRAYSPGDDVRFIDWNVFSRTERTYLKRYLGETNTHLMVLFDASGSMGFGSHEVTKIEYARYAAASLSYLSIRQHDAIGLIVFDEKVRDFRPPSTRPAAPSTSRTRSSPRPASSSGSLRRSSAASRWSSSFR